MKTILTIEESARLIELGVDESHASSKTVIVEKAGLCGRWESEVPIFTLADLISILPKEIDGNILVINATGFNKETEKLEEGWTVFYVNYKYDVAFGEASIFSAPELIDALNQLAIWAIEQGHLKTEKK